MCGLAVSRGVCHTWANGREGAATRLGRDTMEYIDTTIYLAPCSPIFGVFDCTRAFFTEDEAREYVAECGLPHCVAVKKIALREYLDNPTN